MTVEVFLNGRDLSAAAAAALAAALRGDGPDAADEVIPEASQGDWV